MRPSAVLLSALLVAASATAAHAGTIQPLYIDDAFTLPQRQVIQRAISDWTSSLAFEAPNTQIVPINFGMTSGGTAPGSPLAQWTFSPSGAPAFPYSTTITHFININADVLDRMWISLDAPAPTDGYDLLTIIRHELGHALGMAPGIYFDSSTFTDKWASHVAGGVFDPGGLNVPLFVDRAHVNISSDLMYGSLGPGVRKEISVSDVQMLSLAYGYTATAIPEPATLLPLFLGAGALLMKRRRR